MQPGETISPGQAPAPPQPESSTPPPQPAPVPAPEIQQPTPPATPDATSDQEAAWKFSANDVSNDPEDPESSHPLSSTTKPVNWTASEYIQHQKGIAWFLAAGVAIVAVAAVAYLITGDVTSGILVGVAGLAFAAFGARPPQVLEYAVDGVGVHIGQKFYPYGNFRSFSIQTEDAVRSILLMPVQRVGLPITLYYDPKDEDDIVDVLGASLPHEPREVSPIDKFMRKIRF